MYGICEDKLYMLINEMVSADHIHALDLYVFQEEKDCFEFLWSKPIPFKLNTNVYKMANGKLLLPGRIAELDGFPNTPAVLISDSGKIDDDWRLVYIQENGDLPDGSKLVHPEITAIIEDNKIAMFSRDDERKVPLVYLSQDYGETWSDAFSYDIPFSDSKIYAGTLSDGRNYIIGNWYPGREKLVLVFSKPKENTFETGIILQNGFSDRLGYGKAWCYPCAYEADHKLYIIYTVYLENEKKRGCIVRCSVDITAPVFLKRMQKTWI